MKTILVVEDDNNLRNAIVESLEMEIEINELKDIQIIACRNEQEVFESTKLFVDPNKFTNSDEIVAVFDQNILNSLGTDIFEKLVKDYHIGGRVSQFISISGIVEGLEPMIRDMLQRNNLNIEPKMMRKPFSGVEVARQSLMDSNEMKPR